MCIILGTRQRKALPCAYYKHGKGNTHGKQHFYRVLDNMTHGKKKHNQQNKFSAVSWLRRYMINKIHSATTTEIFSEAVIFYFQMRAEPTASEQTSKLMMHFQRCFFTYLY